jgi:hypothetical protein
VFIQVVIIAIDGQGPSYDGTMVCTIVPQITTLFVSYSGQWVFTWELVDDVEPSIPAPATVSYAVMSALENALSYGQSLTSNVVVDSITTILDNQGATQASLPYMISYPFLMVSFKYGIPGRFA